MPLPLLTALLATLAADPPLAGSLEKPAVQAARPARWEKLPAFDRRRLRWSAGIQAQSLPLLGPGGGALGATVSAALELERHEVAIGCGILGAPSAQSAAARNTGLSGSHLKLAYRLVPFAGNLRVGVEAGAQLGWERSWAWCVDHGGTGAQCGFVPGGPSYAALAGPVFHGRIGTLSLLLGLDLMLRGPRLPAAVGASPLALQAWFELGFGGLPR